MSALLESGDAVTTVALQLSHPEGQLLLTNQAAHHVLVLLCSVELGENTQLLSQISETILLQITGTFNFLFLEDSTYVFKLDSINLIRVITVNSKNTDDYDEPIFQYFYEVSLLVQLSAHLHACKK